MDRAENTVFAEENKKQKLLEDNVRKHEEKRQKDEYFEVERKKHQISQY